MHVCMYICTDICMYIYVVMYRPSSKSLPTVPGPSSLNLSWNEDIVLVNSFTCSQVICIHTHIHAINYTYDVV